MRHYLRTPGLNLRLLNLPDYSPDFNADEAIWGWAEEEATGKLSLGTRAAVQEQVDSFLAGLASRPDEERRRCRKVLQFRAKAHLRDSCLDIHDPASAHPPWLWFSTPGFRGYPVLPMGTITNTYL